MLGIVAIQIYWIRNSIILKDAQFRRSVKVALTEVNGILERSEKLYRLEKLNYSKLRLRVDSARASALKNPLVLQSDNPSSDSSTLKGQTEAFNFEVFKKSKSATFTALRNSDEIDRAFEQEKQVLEESLREQYPFDDFDSEELIELMVQFSMIEKGTNILKRFSETELDSLINFALAEYGGIHTEYHFGIYDSYNHPLVLPERSRAFNQDIVEDGYKMKLLPRDYLTADSFLHIWFPNRDTYLMKTLWPLLASSSLFLITIILAFSYTIRTIFRQKKISEIKNDFINNMTHELKTPIATISLACEALNDPVMSNSAKNVSQYVGMIRDENKRLGVLVENVLKSAVLDRGEMELAKDDVDIHELIRNTIRNIELQVSQKGGRIEQALKADNAVIKGDKVHLTNVFYNLMDNAIKYSKENPLIQVETTSDDSSISIRVKDQGIGIRKDDQARIFDKLFRVPTGNIHNIKGFGLGLSYVKVIVEKHHGTVSVASELGKGSTFTIQLPFNYDL